MADIDTALAASKDAVEQLIVASGRTGSAWAAAPAPGKWSPSQIAEHVARALEESANMAAQRPSKFPTIPAVVRPLVRTLLFKRVLRKASFPKAKTNKAMNPATGPGTPAEARTRLELAHRRFEDACRQLASQNVPMRTTTFGTVGVEDYVRFIELHTRHHTKQVAGIR